MFGGSTCHFLFEIKIAPLCTEHYVLQKHLYTQAHCKDSWKHFTEMLLRTGFYLFPIISEADLFTSAKKEQPECSTMSLGSSDLMLCVFLRIDPLITVYLCCQSKSVVCSKAFFLSSTTRVDQQDMYINEPQKFLPPDSCIPVSNCCCD